MYLKNVGIRKYSTFRLTLTRCGTLNAYKIASAISLGFKNKHAFITSILICSVIPV